MLLVIGFPVIFSSTEVVFFLYLIIYKEYNNISWRFAKWWLIRTLWLTLLLYFISLRAHDADEKAMSEQKAANPKG